MRIALLSDTHGFIDERFVKHLSACDEIWHAGDIGAEETAFRLMALKPLRAVYGNIDDQILRKHFSHDLRFETEGVTVWMRHIGGYPGHYERPVHEVFLKDPPRLFICGHSHILKIQYDKRFGLLYVNPGAAGKNGFHTVQTMVTFSLTAGEIKDMEVVELNRH
jgi:uncharacterized protein